MFENHLSELEFQINQDGVDIGWGVLVNFQRRMNPKDNPMTCKPTYVLDVVIALDREKSLDSVIFSTGFVNNLVTLFKGKYQLNNDMLFCLIGWKSYRTSCPEK